MVAHAKGSGRAPCSPNSGGLAWSPADRRSSSRSEIPMRSSLLALFTLAWLSPNLSAQTATAKVDGKYPTLGTIERADKRLDALIPKDARVEQIAEGFDWSEGPVWEPKRQVLLFS